MELVSVMMVTSVPKTTVINKIPQETSVNIDFMQTGTLESTSVRKQKFAKPFNVLSTNVFTLPLDVPLETFASSLFVTNPPMDHAKHTQLEHTKSIVVEFVQVTVSLVSQLPLEALRKLLLLSHWELVWELVCSLHLSSLVLSPEPLMLLTLLLVLKLWVLSPLPQLTKEQNITWIPPLTNVMIKEMLIFK